MAIPFDLGNAVAAIGALGLASFALVDVTKIGRQGGVSNSGFIFIELAIRQMLPNERRSVNVDDPERSRTLLDILHANWIAGVACADQKAIAKSLIKLRVSPATATQLASATSVDADILKTIAIKMNDGSDLTASEANVLGRFDLMLTALLDEGYQRADQRYRNASRVLASVIAVVLAVFGGWAVSHSPVEGSNATLSASEYFFHKDMWIALIAGLLATPLAPISKDLASALQAAVKVAQAVKK
jgi:hypothetical protein